MTAPVTDASVVKRSLTLQGHRTSVTLEPPFWDALLRMAAREGLSLNAVAARIDSGRAPGESLASALRVAILRDALSRAGSGGDPP